MAKQNTARNIANLLKDPNEIKGVYLHTREPLQWVIAWHLIDHYGRSSEGFNKFIKDIRTKATALGFYVFNLGSIREVLAYDYISNNTDNLSAVCRILGLIRETTNFIEVIDFIKSALCVALPLYVRQVVATVYGFAPALYTVDEWADAFEGAFRSAKFADECWGMSWQNYAIYLLNDEEWDTYREDDLNPLEDVVRALIETRGEYLDDKADALHGQDNNPDYLAAIRGGVLALHRLGIEEGSIQ